MGAPRRLDVSSSDKEKGREREGKEAANARRQAAEEEKREAERRRRQAVVDKARTVEAKARADWERAQQALHQAEKHLAEI